MQKSVPHFYLVLFNASLQHMQQLSFPALLFKPKIGRFIYIEQKNGLK